MTIYRGFSTYNRNRRFNVSDYDLIKQDIFNHFNIRRGEKLMRPNFGTRLWSWLFEPLNDDLILEITEEVKNVCAADPRVRVETVNVQRYQHGIFIQIDFLFTTDNVLDTMTLQFNRDNSTLTLA
jgi:phage baseplate assembly protein W